MEFKLAKEEATPKIVRSGGDLLHQWQTELDGYYREMLEFQYAEPDTVFRSLSAWTARASYMRSQIQRSGSKTWQTFRTGELDPFIGECDRQFRQWSRTFAVHSLDWNMQRGQT